MTRLEQRSDEGNTGAGAAYSPGNDRGHQRRRRRITAGAVAAGLLGVVALAVVPLLGQPVDRPEPVPSAGPVSITGTAAVRPDRITRALELAGTAGATGPGDPGSVNAELAEDDPDEVLQPVAEPVSDPVLATVTRFYEKVTTAPADAFDLLGPQLQGSGYPDFEAAWSSVLQVQIEGVRKVAPNAALVAVRLERAQRPVLRIVQRLVVGDGGRIRDATLLSAVSGRG